MQFLLKKRQLRAGKPAVHFQTKELLKTKLGGTRKGREAHGEGGGVCEGSTPLDHRQGGVREG